ncbi:hypothetical protein [Pseudomonas sp. NA-150]|uniref:hypothetical protein n=1 Tax=Pseudomonas sp. NA-150 TaxID=3367525 RepID=UPI0037CC79CE
MRTLLPAVLLLVSVSGAVMADQSITRSVTPFSITRPGVAGGAMYTMRMADFPGRGWKTPRLNSIQLRTTYFPNSIGETVEVCFMSVSQRGLNNCIDASPNALIKIERFNTQRFDVGVSLYVRHHAQDGKQNSRPAGQDTMTFNYSYY